MIILCLFTMAGWMQATNPTRAMLYSALVPGAGQFYNGKYLKGALVIGLQGYQTAYIIHHDKKIEDYRKLANSETNPLYASEYRSRIKEQQEMRTSRFWWIGITALLSMMDAYVDAHLSDFEQEKEGLHLKFTDSTLGVEYRF